MLALLPKAPSRCLIRVKSEPYSADLYESESVQQLKQKVRQVLASLPFVLRRGRKGDQVGEVIELLDLMTADNKRGPAYTQPGDGGDGSAQKGWDFLAKVMRQTLEAEGIGDLENGIYNQWFAGVPVGSTVYYRLYCYLLYQKVSEIDQWGVIEMLKARNPKHKSKSRVVDFEGVDYTSDFLLSLLQVLKVAKHLPIILDEPCVVVDIGGGWGRIGNALWTINRNAAYIHVDIPITSVLAQYYLPTTIEAPVYRYPFYRDKKCIRRSDILGKPGFHFVGSHQIGTLDNSFADTVYNVASFGEMSNSTVESYFSNIDRICDGFFIWSKLIFLIIKMVLSYRVMIITLFFLIGRRFTCEILT